MDSRILSLVSNMTTRPGASDKDLAQLTDVLGIAPPPDYRELLAYSNGLDGFIGENYLALYGVQDVLACHTSYTELWQELGEDLSFLVFIGSDGAGEGFAYDTRSPDMPVVNVPFLVELKLVRVMGKTLSEFLERLSAKPLFD